MKHVCAIYITVGAKPYTSVVFRTFIKNKLILFAFVIYFAYLDQIYLCATDNNVVSVHDAKIM